MSSDHDIYHKRTLCLSHQIMTYITKGTLSVSSDHDICHKRTLCLYHQIMTCFIQGRNCLFHLLNTDDLNDQYLCFLTNSVLLCISFPATVYHRTVCSVFLYYANFVSNNPTDGNVKMKHSLLAQLIMLHVWLIMLHGEWKSCRMVN